MRNILIAATAVLTFTACSSSSESTTFQTPAETLPAEEPVVETTTTVAVTITTEAPVPVTRPTVPVVTEPPLNGYQPDVFLDQVRSDISYWYYSYGDDALVDMGLLLCQEIDNGNTVDRVLVDFYLIAQNQDPTLAENAGLYLRYVVRYLCPEHFWQIDALND